MTIRFLFFTLAIVAATVTNTTLAMQAEVNAKNALRTCITCNRIRKPNTIITLPCGDRFCKRCLVGHYTYSLARNTQTVCRHKTVLPNEVIANITAYPEYDQMLADAHRQKNEEDSLEQLRLEQEQEAMRCKRCSTKDNPKIAGRILACGHRFCTNCLVVQSAHAIAFCITPACPTCNVPMFDSSTGNLENHLKNHKHYRTQFLFAKRCAQHPKEACLICGNDEIKADVVLSCGHAMCLLCLQTLQAHNHVHDKETTCPFCRTVALKEQQPSERKDPLLRMLECDDAHRVHRLRKDADQTRKKRLEEQSAADRRMALEIARMDGIPLPRSMQHRARANRHQ